MQLLRAICERAGHTPAGVAAVLCACLVVSRVGCVAAANREPTSDLVLVHLTDLHCATRTQNPEAKILFDPHVKDLVHSFQWLQAAVRDINRNVRPDTVVVTGDLVDKGRDVDDLRKVRRILDGLSCPYYPVPGDHDSRKAFRDVFDRPPSYAFTCGPWRFIALDASSGAVSRESLTLLREELGDLAEPRAAVLVHRPLVMGPVEIAAARLFYGVRLRARNADRVLEMLDGHPRVRLVLAGHCHHNTECQRGDAVHLTTGCLIEPGHAYRVLRLRGREIRSALREVRLDAQAQQR
ncbi:MAG: metallophosphoesterase [Planctomycetota bacterium]|nr:metallophosphoesterase [Planctomycetota bacterium]